MYGVRQGVLLRAHVSSREVTEFWMLEPEMAWYDWEDNIALQEELVVYLIEYSLANHRDDLEALERDLSSLESVMPPFPRLSYDEAIDLLRAAGSTIEWGQDFGGEDQTLLTAEFDRPVFVHSFPRAAKAFYMKEHPDRSDLVLCDDLFAPEGFGEIIGGSQREDDHDRLIEQIRQESVWLRTALGLRFGPRANGSLDLRLAAPARSDSIPSLDQPALALGGFLPLDLAPELIELVQRLIFEHHAALGSQCFETLKSCLELAVGVLKGGVWMDVKQSAPVDQREQQVAKLFLEWLWQPRLGGDARLRELLVDLGASSIGSPPVEPDSRHFLLYSVGTNQRR